MCYLTGGPWEEREGCDVGTVLHQVREQSYQITILLQNIIFPEHWHQPIGFEGGKRRATQPMSKPKKVNTWLILPIVCFSQRFGQVKAVVKNSFSTIHLGGASRGRKWIGRKPVK